ncbi:MAG: hypothetical protein U1F43_35020, partial [Myxococcota bacterium]
MLRAMPVYAGQASAVHDHVLVQSRDDERLRLPDARDVQDSGLVGLRQRRDVSAFARFLEAVPFEKGRVSVLRIARIGGPNAAYRAVETADRRTLHVFAPDSEDDPMRAFEYLSLTLVTAAGGHTRHVIMSTLPADDVPVAALLHHELETGQPLPPAFSSERTLVSTWEVAESFELVAASTRDGVAFQRHQAQAWQRAVAEADRALLELRRGDVITRPLCVDLQHVRQNGRYLPGFEALARAVLEGQDLDRLDEGEAKQAAWRLMPGFDEPGKLSALTPYVRFILEMTRGMLPSPAATRTFGQVSLDDAPSRVYGPQSLARHAYIRPIERDDQLVAVAVCYSAARETDGQPYDDELGVGERSRIDAWCEAVSLDDEPHRRVAGTAA